MFLTQQFFSLFSIIIDYLPAMRDQITSKCYCVLFIFIIFIYSVNAQEIILSQNISFQHENEILDYALLGGLDTPQFVEMDFNNDGIQDLLVFDRLGFVPLTFINGGTPNTVDYTYAPEYGNIFPAKMNNWVIARDYNGDGIIDLFSNSLTPRSEGIAVFQGYYENDRLQFEQILFPQYNRDILYFPFTVGNNTQFFEVFVPALDYPAIDDMDGDGDLDILSFNPGGSKIEFYKNISVEEGYGKDSLIYRLQDECWGGIYESDNLSETSLSEMPGGCADPFEGGGEVDLRHAGSTFLTLDNNADGLKDVVIGDLPLDNLILLINGGTLEQAWINEQISEFPVDEAVNIPSFPAAFYLDVDNDGVKDLIASSNEAARGENYSNAWLYLNKGLTNQPEFELQTKTFLVDQMVDVGSNARPVFVDVNGDSLLDLVVANLRIYSNENNQDSRLYYYENIGTLTEPAFHLITDDWLGFSDFNSNSFDFAPAFGDLDGDGDQDLIVGDDAGVLFYCENKGGVGSPMVFDEFEYSYMGIDVGKNARPQIVDINQDGLLDLVIGERGGNNNSNGACGTLNYFQNIGTATEPMFSNFSSAPNSSCFGRVFTIPQNEITSFSSPAFWDFGDHLELFVGTEIGEIKRYTDISTDPDSTYTLLNESFINNKIGKHLAPAIADINNDGLLDFLVGNARGGLNFFTSDIKAQFEVPTSTTTVDNKLELKAYPNPSHDVLYLSFAKPLSSTAVLEVFNVNGQKVHQQQINALQTAIDVSNWSKGIYVIRVFQTNTWTYRKVIID